MWFLTLAWIQTDTELVLGLVLGSRPAQMEFGGWFSGTLRIMHSAELLTKGKQELVTVRHHGPQRWVMIPVTLCLTVTAAVGAPELLQRENKKLGCVNNQLKSGCLGGSVD